MTDKKDEVFWIELGFLPVEVGYAPNQKAWKKALKDLGLPKESFPGSDGRCNWWVKDGKNIILITVGNRARKQSLSQVTGIIAHECMHAWRYIRTIIGEAEPSTEFEAYVLQGLVQHITFAHQQRRAKPWKQP